MYRDTDKKRLKTFPPKTVESEEYRTPFRKDYARVIHCPSFRRLQGKTQLYPGSESDFFRNRLTHSLEVAQIAKSIAIRINNTFIKDSEYQVDTDMCELAGISHDLGHPPFGHQGEAALDECMRDYGGFEGNAQTLRILSRLEKKHIVAEKFKKGKDMRVGLNLTYRSLASILKYDKVIPFAKNQREEDDKNKPIKGYYESEKDLVASIKKHVTGDSDISGFKTIECQIMDIADDIAYSNYDLEDGLKAGFYTPFKILFADESVVSKVASKMSESFGSSFSSSDVRDVLFDIFGKIFVTTSEDSVPKEHFLGLSIKTAELAFGSSNLFATDGHYRTELTSSLVGSFIRAINFELNKDCPALSTVRLDEDMRKKVEVLKTFTFESQIVSSKLRIAEYRGKEIVSTIFKALNTGNGYQLMPHDHRECFESCPTQMRQRIICDYIAGMTDRYAIEFYGRLRSEKPETIFKPF